MPGRLAAVALALAVVSAPAWAAPPLVAKGTATPLAAWTVFCDEYPDECAVDPAEPETVAATPDFLALVDKVNREVNGEVEPRTDQDHWGILDRWSFPFDRIGDCEDFQLLKRRLLVQAGVPRRALRMTVVINELGEGHAVLTVRTDGDDLILDNRTNQILKWDETGYAFIKRESSTRVGWDMIEPAPGIATVATAR
jgi:predicted transglutaminase-like cysteine proteinase